MKNQYINVRETGIEKTLRLGLVTTYTKKYIVFQANTTLLLCYSCYSIKQQSFIFALQKHKRLRKKMIRGCLICLALCKALKWLIFIPIFTRERVKTNNRKLLIQPFYWQRPKKVIKRPPPPPPLLRSLLHKKPLLSYSALRSDIWSKAAWYC